MSHTRVGEAWKRGLRNVSRKNYPSERSRFVSVAGWFGTDSHKPKGKEQKNGRNDCINHESQKTYRTTQASEPCSPLVARVEHVAALGSGCRLGRTAFPSSPPGAPNHQTLMVLTSVTFLTRES